MKKLAAVLAMTLTSATTVQAGCLERTELINDQITHTQLSISPKFEMPRDNTIFVFDFLQEHQGAPPDCHTSESCWMSFGYSARLEWPELKLYRPGSTEPVVSVMMQAVNSSDRWYKESVAGQYLKSQSPVDGFDFYLLQIAGTQSCANETARLRAFGVGDIDPAAQCREYRIETFRSEGSNNFVRPDDARAQWSDTSCFQFRQGGGASSTEPPPKPR